jgi:hypothetical protein
MSAAATSPSPEPDGGSLKRTVERTRDEQTRVQLLKDISLMLAYSLEEGLELDPVTAQLVGGDQDNKAIDALPMSLLVTLHGALSKTVAPATPGSLEATEPATGVFGFLRRPPIVGWMVLAAVLCATGFAVAVAQKQSTLSWISGAGLGAAFYGLFTVHDYVKQRTFDPRYNSVYMIRFVLGVIAGIILAQLPIFNNAANLKDLGQGVIALLGGFSAEAVNQILQRLVDIMITAVKGSGADVAQAQVEQVKTKAATQLATTKQAVSTNLSDILSDPGLPQNLRDRLKEIQNNLK